MSEQGAVKARSGQPIAGLFMQAVLFRYWKIRYEIRRSLRYSVIGVFALSVWGLLRDLVVHSAASPSPGLTGIAASYLLNVINHPVTSRLAPVLYAPLYQLLVIASLLAGRVTTVLHRPPFQLLVVGFLVYLTWNHWKEAQKPRYEYAFVKSLYDFQLKLKSGSQMTLAEALE